MREITVISSEQLYKKLESVTPDFINFDSSNNKVINFDWSLVSSHKKYDWYIQYNKTKKIITYEFNLSVGTKVKNKNNIMV